MMPKDNSGLGQLRQRTWSHAGRQDSDLRLETCDELVGDAGKDNEWLHAAAIDPALYLKDL
ncbi:MAG: hypothetical protein AVDCRST_MAG37-647 [uncultured Rubrobacteraceae bacterium]|uniref:Uncharacterized protein n=1 Tax=uncultured Rubrobacteraceae bacterium TaxID=349277 RepID=A0A6J4Q640_9ACTN|nr:MAG: hypothetical protein AVDCRST_MAG37-647 [uncultured Rubrobacteraceae bacterium]